MTPDETIDVPDYILCWPQKDDVPIMLASCDKEDIDDLIPMKHEGQYIYKLVVRMK